MRVAFIVAAVLFLNACVNPSHEESVPEAIAYLQFGMSPSDTKFNYTVDSPSKVEVHIVPDTGVGDWGVVAEQKNCYYDLTRAFDSLRIGIVSIDFENAKWREVRSDGQYVRIEGAKVCQKKLGEGIMSLVDADCVGHWDIAPRTNFERSIDVIKKACPGAAAQSASEALPKDALLRQVHECQCGLLGRLGETQE